MISDWQDSVANADMADWVTVAAYLLTAALTARASRHAGVSRQARDRTFWRVTTALLIFLGINELLDLQTLLTAVGRAHAKANGWYEARRTVQLVFIVALVIAAAVAGLTMLWFTRRSQAALLLAYAGLVFIGLFVILRAASFHHLDVILGSGAKALNWGSLQELLGVVIVAVSAVLYARQHGATG